jgi:hypothetical protein
MHLADYGGLTEPWFGMYKYYHADIFTPGPEPGFFVPVAAIPGGIFFYPSTPLSTEAINENIMAS